MSRSNLTLYCTQATRSFTALWMLEELGLAYRSVIADRASPDYLRINPSAMTPTLVDGDAVVREAPAICTYLADRYSYGVLAPRIEEPARGAYLSWLVFATAQLEPAQATRNVVISAPPGTWGPGWQALPDVVRVLADALAPGPYLLGERLTAADVMVGSAITMRLHTQEIPADPILVAYSERLSQRPAGQRAGALNWPS